MKTKYVILRAVETKPRPRMRGKTPTPEAKEFKPASPLAVEFEDMNADRAREVSRQKEVKAVAPTIRMKLIAPIEIAASEDPLENGSTWGVKAVSADTSPFTGEGVTVAVLDTGIDPTHPAFQGVNLIRKNFTQESDNDIHGHGTHCAGTIFGRDVEGTRIGIARGVSNAVIGKVLGQGGGGSDIVMEAIQWALQNGAQVISMSLGIDFPGYVAELIQDNVPAELATSIALEGYRANLLLFQSLAELVKTLGSFSKICTLVAAAGNESRLNQSPDFEIAVSPPAVAEGIVSVAAVGVSPQGFTIAPFSNVGARVCGPGVGVLSAKLGGGLTPKNGTSMATPHVAGVAALWAQKLQSSNQFTSQLFVDRLVGAATTIGLKPGFVPSHVGAGMIRAPQS